MSRKSNVTQHVLNRVLEKARKRNKLKEQQQPKTLYEVFDEAGELDEKDNGNGGGV